MRFLKMIMLILFSYFSYNLALNGVSSVDNGNNNANDLISLSSISLKLRSIISFCKLNGGFEIIRSQSSGGFVLKKSFPKSSNLCVALYFNLSSSAFNLNSLS